MTKNSLPKSSPLLANLIWISTVAWIINRPLLAGSIGIVLVQTMIPVGLAITIHQLTEVLVETATSSQIHWHTLGMWVGLTFGITLLELMTRLSQAYIQTRLSDDMRLHLYTAVMTNISALPITEFETGDLQDMLERTQGRKAVIGASSAVSDTANVLSNLAQSISLLGVVLWIEPSVLMLMGVVLPHAAFQWFLARRRYQLEYQRTPEKRWMRYFMWFVMSPQHGAEIKMLGLSPHLVDRYASALTRIRSENRRMARLDWLGTFGFGTGMLVVFFGLLVRILKRVATGALSVGNVVVYIGSITRLQGSTQGLSQNIGKLRENMLFVDDIRRLLLPSSPDLLFPSAALPVTPSPLTFEQVTFCYGGSSRNAVTDLSLTIHPGEIVAIVGENGAGKTTLVKLLAGLYQPTQGTIRYGETDVAHIESRQWMNLVSFVFQNFNRYEASVTENIAYGDWDAWKDRLDDIPTLGEQVDLQSVVDTMPRGYATQLGRYLGEHQPSDGQWQKIAVARGFARQKSHILILDEPSAHLDARAERELFEQFKTLAQGRTTLLISHRLDTVKSADRILVLKGGRLIEMGTHESLLAQAGHYASLYRFQVGFNWQTV